MKNKYLKLIFILLFSLLFNQYSFTQENLFEFNADNIQYKDNAVLAQGNAKIYDNAGKIIYSDKIVYDKNKNTINTFSNTKFVDEKKNIIFAENITYDIKSGRITSNQKVKLIDSKGNTFNFSNISYNVLTKKGLAKNFYGRNEDGSNFKSEKIIFDLYNDQFKLKNSFYTTCIDKKNKKKDYCPSWSLNSSETIHDKKNKLIKHKNTLLKIKKLPILYVPYLEHPDPTVKRQTGFLPPLFKNNSSVGKNINLPYFVALDTDKDLTITPVLYYKENPLFLFEFRKKYQNSSLVVDTSYTEGFKNLDNSNKNEGSRNHFYLNYNLNFDNSYFDKNQLNLQIQKVSEHNYLKAHKINTLLTKEDDKQLENKLQILSYNNNIGVDISAKIFEDLNKFNNNKYEYVLPKGSVSLIQNKYNQNINFKSDFFARKFNGKDKSVEIINNIDTVSSSKHLKGIGSSHLIKTQISNINLYYKDEFNNSNSTSNYLTMALDNSLPLYKRNKQSQQILIPRIFLKYTTGKMENNSEADKNLFYSDIFSMNRSVNSNNPETGMSAGVGVDYEFNKKDDLNNIYLKNLIGIGQIFRTSKMEQLPNKSSLNNKQSSFAGFYNLTYYGEDKEKLKDKNLSFANSYSQNKIDFKYDFNLNKNLNSLDRNLFTLNSVIFNKIGTVISFDEKNKYAGNERKVDYGLNFLLNKNYFLTSSIIEDLKNNFKESENIGINYENDCIRVSLNLKKEYYNNALLSSNKSIFLSILIKPFANDIKPDLSSFIK